MRVFPDPERYRFQEGPQKVREDRQGRLSAEVRRPVLLTTSLTSQIQCLDLYMTQKVAKASFHDGQVLEELLKEMEDEYTVRFGACGHANHLRRYDELTRRKSQSHRERRSQEGGQQTPWLVHTGNSE